MITNVAWKGQNQKVKCFSIKLKTTSSFHAISIQFFQNVPVLFGLVMFFICLSKGKNERSEMGDEAEMLL